MLSLSHSLIKTAYRGPNADSEQGQSTGIQVRNELPNGEKLESSDHQLVEVCLINTVTRSQVCRAGAFTEGGKDSLKSLRDWLYCFIVNQYNILVHKRPYTLSILANRKYLALCESLSFVCLAEDDLISRRPNQSAPLATNKHPLLINKT